MSLKQPKLESFFNPVQAQKQCSRQVCFIYDASRRVAFFESMPLISDRFISITCKIRLYYRGESYPRYREESQFTEEHISLFKSNLQKAVRQINSYVACQSVIELVRLSPTELVRRLPIIMIEDVTLFEQVAIPVWMMMAGINYSLTLRDVDTLLQITEKMCETIDYFPDVKASYTSLSDIKEIPALMAVYYRREYGGMKGDMLLLAEALSYYRENPEKILTFEFKQKSSYQPKDGYTIILSEAIDFHCYPQMLSYLSNRTTLMNEQAKEWIWNAQSGVNKRKEATMERSKRYKETEEWAQLVKPLEIFRKTMLSRLRRIE